MSLAFKTKALDNKISIYDKYNMLYKNVETKFTNQIPFSYTIIHENEALISRWLYLLS